jgi:hypothetical protein
MNRAVLWLMLGLVIAVAAPPPARAQVAGSSANLQRYQQKLDQFQRETALLANPIVPADQRLLFDYGGYMTFSYLSVDDLNHDNHGLRQYDLVGYARLNLDDVQEFYARGRLTWQDFNPGDSFSGRGDEFDARMDRLYYRFDLQKAMAAYQGKKVDYDVAIQAGRELVYWANGLTLVQDLDGAVVNLSYQLLDLQLLASITPADTIDIDDTRPHFDTNTHRGFYGAMLSAQVGLHRPFLYFLSQQDYNHNYLLQTGPITTAFNYNSYYIGGGSGGSLNEHWNYGLEGVFEGGRGLSNSFTTANGAFAQAVQTEQKIRAWAFDMRADYLLNDPNRSHIAGEATVASGDTDRRHTTNTFGGNKSGTDDNAFNAFGQINNGLAFAPTVSNIMILRVGGSTFPLVDHDPFRQLETGADLFFFGKWKGEAPIDEPTTHDRFLGIEPDVFVNWQLKSDITLALRYGVFMPSVAMPSRDVRQFFYGGLTFAF